MSDATIEKMETVDTPVEVVEKPKPYNFRTLGGGDVFLMFRIISKIGVKEFNACFEHDGIKHLVAAMMGEKLKAKEAEKDANAEAETAAEEELEAPSMSVTYISVILEIADVIFRNLPKCESEIFQMLSQTSDLSVNEVRKLPLGDFTEMIIDFIQKEEFRDFIKVVSRLFK